MESKLDNVDIFNCAAMEIFHICLENIPISIEVDPTELALEVAGYFKLSDSDQEFSNQFQNIDQVCLYTIWWLRDENYIRIGDQMMDGACNIVMTEKCLNTINKIPNILDNKKTFRNFFHTGLSTLPFTVASSVISEFFKNSS